MLVLLHNRCTKTMRFACMHPDISHLLGIHAKSSHNILNITGAVFCSSCTFCNMQRSECAKEILTAKMVLESNENACNATFARITHQQNIVVRYVLSMSEPVWCAPVNVHGKRK